MNVPLNKATIIVPIPIPTIPWNKNKEMKKYDKSYSNEVKKVELDKEQVGKQTMD